MNKKKTEKDKAPIIDGDARPDMPADNEEVKDQRKREKPATGEKFESERNSDVNSLEDFKDAK